MISTGLIFPGQNYPGGIMLDILQRMSETQITRTCFIILFQLNLL